MGPIDLNAYRNANLPELAKAMGIDYYGLGGAQGAAPRPMVSPQAANAARSMARPTMNFDFVPRAMPQLNALKPMGPRTAQPMPQVDPAAIMALLRSMPGVLAGAGVGAAAPMMLAGGSVDPNVAQFYAKRNAAPMPTRQPLGVAGQRY